MKINFAILSSLLHTLAALQHQDKGKEIKLAASSEMAPNNWLGAAGINIAKSSRQAIFAAKDQMAIINKATSFNNYKRLKDSEYGKNLLQSIKKAENSNQIHQHGKREKRSAHGDIIGKKICIHNPKDSSKIRAHIHQEGKSKYYIALDIKSNKPGMEVSFCEERYEVRPSACKGISQIEFISSICTNNLVLWCSPPLGVYNSLRDFQNDINIPDQYKLKGEEKDNLIKLVDNTEYTLQTNIFYYSNDTFKLEYKVDNDQILSKWHSLDDYSKSEIAKRECSSQGEVLTYNSPYFNIVIIMSKLNETSNSYIIYYTGRYTQKKTYEHTAQANSWKMYQKEAEAKHKIPDKVLKLTEVKCKKDTVLYGYESGKILARHAPLECPVGTFLPDSALSYTYTEEAMQLHNYIV